MRAKSSKQRCPALCIMFESYYLEVSQQLVTQKVFPSVVLAQRQACFLKIIEKIS